jgi:hypothetical protein
VNEMILVREGIMKLDIQGAVADNNFNTEAYLLGLYKPIDKKLLKDYSPTGNKKRGATFMKMVYYLPNYRLRNRS